MNRYDFSEIAAFLDNSVEWDDLYNMVCDAMRILSTPKKHISDEQQRKVWSTLLTCADFIDTIEFIAHAQRICAFSND